jgi:hypothetical protein
MPAVKYPTKLSKPRAVGRYELLQWPTFHLPKPCVE